MTNLSNEHRLKQNIRVTSINEFNRIIGGMNRSEILTFDEGIENNSGLSEEEKNNIHQILQGSSGGTYFIDDITKGGILSDDDSEDILKNKLASFNYHVPNTTDFILYFEGENDTGSSRLSTTSIKAALVDEAVNYKKVTKTVDDKEIEGYGYSSTGNAVVNKYINNNPDSIPDRFNNPTIAAISFLEGRFSIPNRGSDEINLFFNAIPTLEMSKCTPYISLIMVYGKAKNESNNMSLGSFLRFLRDENGELVVDEGISLTKDVTRVMGSVNSEKASMNSSNKNDIFKSLSTEKNSTAEAGIELFLSPQTLSNSNIVSEKYGENILEPIMPLMSLESFDVSISGLGYGLYASKTANLKIHLHDRSRLADIAPLVSPEQFGETRIIIEYGWSHPDEGLESGNPIGQFLGSLRDIGIFTVSASKMNFSGQGASIDIRLAMMGGDDSNSVNIACGKYVQGKIFKPQIESIIKKIQNDINPDAYDKNQLKEIRKKHKLSVRESTSSRAIVDYGEYLTALKLAGLADNGQSRNDEAFIDYIKGMFNIGIDPEEEEEEEKPKEGFTPTEANMRLVDAVGAKLQSLYTAEDPFVGELVIAQAKSVGLDTNDMTKETFESMLNEQFKEVSGVTPYSRNYRKQVDEDNRPISKQKYNELMGTILGYRTEVCTLGLIMTKFVAESLVTTSRYDQVQLCFYPFNHQSGGARIYSTASYPIVVQNFITIMQDKIFKDPNFSVNKFLKILDREVINDFENPVYGLSSEMQQKSSLRKLTLKSLKEMTKEQLESMNLPQVFTSIRKKLVSKKKLTKEEKEAFRDAKKRLLDDNKNSITNKLLQIYSTDNNGSFIGDPKFVIPDLGVYYETLPAIKPSNNNMFNRIDDEYDNKNILRIHVYDKNYSADPEILHLKDLMASGDVTTEVAGDNTSKGKIDPDKVMSLSAKKIKDVIKSRVPSITYGTSFCNATSFSLNGMGTSGGSIGNTLFLTALTNKGTPQAGHGGVSNIDDMTVMPMEASLGCLGMPIINRGNQIYIDMSSNTTADNMYAVKSVTHSIRGGDFSTKVSLTFIAQNSIKDIRSKIQTVANSLNEKSENKKSQSSEEKKLKQPSQERAAKEKQRRYGFTRDD